MRTGVPERPLQIEYAELSLVGASRRQPGSRRRRRRRQRRAARRRRRHGRPCRRRARRRDRAAARWSTRSGTRAAPLFDPLGFLHLTLGRAHEDVVALGAGLPLEQPAARHLRRLPGAGRSAYWAHVGDSRIYQLRGGRVLERTRDHSHVELLLREGLITEAAGAGPSDAQLRRMLPRRRPAAAGDDAQRPPRAEPGDVLLLCTDGLWAELDDEQIAASRPGAASAACATRSPTSARAPCRPARRRRQHHGRRAALARRLSARRGDHP